MPLSKMRVSLMSASEQELKYETNILLQGNLDLETRSFQLVETKGIIQNILDCLPTRRQSTLLQCRDFV